jgi:anti-sigma-K factor RskA
MLEQKISLLELELVSAKIEKEQALLAVVKQWQDRLMKAVEEARKDATKEAEIRINMAEQRASAAEAGLLEVKEMVAKMKKGGVVVV